MTRGRLLVAVVLLAGSSFATPAYAQPTPGASAAEGGRFELSAGLIWIGQAGLGTRDATENAAAGGLYRLFTTTTDVRATSGATVRLGVRATPRIEIEAGGSFSRPALRTAIAGDVEGASPIVAGETLTQIVIDGAANVSLAPWHVGTGMPFVSGGVGYLRQLHQSEVLVETGQTYRLGGGIKWPLAARPGAHLSKVGLRVDAGAIARARGVAFDTRLHVSPTAAASLFVRF